MFFTVCTYFANVVQYVRNKKLNSKKGEKNMQNVTSTSNQVALNAQDEVNFNVENSSNKARSNILSRIASAAYSIIAGVAKFVFDVVTWAPNKIYNLFRPAVAATNDDNIEIQQDTVVASLSESNDVNADNNIPDAIVTEEEELADPVSDSKDWQKAAMIGGGVVGLVAAVVGLAYGAERFSAGTVPLAADICGFSDAVFGRVWTILTDAYCLTGLCNNSYGNTYA